MGRAASAVAASLSCAGVREGRTDGWFALEARPADDGPSTGVETCAAPPPAPGEGSGIPQADITADAARAARTPPTALRAVLVVRVVAGVAAGAVVEGELVRGTVGYSGTASNSRGARPAVVVVRGVGRLSRAGVRGRK